MADQLPVPNAGCFLCGRLGTTLVTTPPPQAPRSSRPALRYECPACGMYEIRSILSSSDPQSVADEFQKEAGFSRDASPLETESAAIEHWNRALEEAERQRRLPKRSAESPTRNTDSSASACA